MFTNLKNSAVKPFRTAASKVITLIEDEMTKTHEYEARRREFQRTGDLAWLQTPNQ